MRLSPSRPSSGQCHCLGAAIFLEPLHSCLTAESLHHSNAPPVVTELTSAEQVEHRSRMPGSPPFQPPGSPSLSLGWVGTGDHDGDKFRVLCTDCFDVPCACANPVGQVSAIVGLGSDAAEAAWANGGPSQTWQPGFGRPQLCVACWDVPCACAGDGVRARPMDCVQAQCAAPGPAPPLCLQCMDTACGCAAGSVALCSACFDLPCSCGSR